MAPKIKMSGANNVVDKELMKIVDDAISAARETGNSELKLGKRKKTKDTKPDLLKKKLRY